MFHFLVHNIRKLESLVFRIVCYDCCLNGSPFSICFLNCYSSMKFVFAESHMNYDLKSPCQIHSHAVISVQNCTTLFPFKVSHYSVETLTLRENWHNHCLRSVIVIFFHIYSRHTHDMCVDSHMIGTGFYQWN